jgi:antitoxin (DNA-binding transcriptional repressor) of toxin-antitoxin stability system
MHHRITATELVRSLGDVLGRVRYRNDSFTVERNGEPVARLSPVPTVSATSLSEAIRAWRDASMADPEFAADLDRVSAADHPPDDPWAS